MGQHLDQAIVFHKQGRYQEAEKHYIEALNEDFNEVGVLFNLSAIYLRSGRVGLAANMLMRGLQLKPDCMEAMNNLGNAFKDRNNDREAEKWFKKGLEVKGIGDGDKADLNNNLATIHVNNGTAQIGIKYAENALKYNPEHPDAHWNRGLMLLELGRYKEGFAEYEWGYRNSGQARIYREYGAVPDWDGSPGKTVVVWGEQGLGDELLFANCLPDLIKISKHVIIDCHPRNVEIFRESFPTCSVYGTRKDSFYNWHYQHKIDGKVAIGSLSHFFRPTLESFPQHDGYLKVAEDKVLKYKERLARLSAKPKIGISWIGGAMKTRRDFRSVTLESLLPILKQDATFISLQYTDCFPEIADFEEDHNIRVHHWPRAVQHPNYAETAGLVQALDLVITVNQSVVHLAGGLGKEQWVMTPKACAWRYYSPDNYHLPWYPAARQFKQKEAGKWGDLIEQVATELDKFLGERK